MAFRQEAGLEDSGPTAGPSSDRQFSKETFVNAILEWIVVDDRVSLIHFHYDYKFGPYPHDNLKPLQVIDCPELWKIFSMLNRELKESDIPH